ncbi:MAG: TPM domain-containing protein [Ignavibacteriales bacterium]|nr:TPM domain-containing protein [Ignavibacteriales bacterium]
MSKKFIYKYLNQEELKSISAKIGEIEKTTSGELVIILKEKRGWFEKTKSVSTLAEKEFVSAKIGKTKGATGILIFIIFNAKGFCILGDKKINEKIDQSIWDDIANTIGNSFKQEQYYLGIINGVEQAGKILSTHFPIQPGDVNELSNEVIIK